MPEMDVNYTAVLIAALISFVLGGFWYSRFLFGKQWMAAMKKTEEDMKQKGKSGVAGAYVLTLILWLVASYILANIINFSGANTLGNGMIIGFLCWFGFTASTSLMHNMFEQRGASLWLINSGYTLTALLISGAIFGVWK